MTGASGALPVDVTRVVSTYLALADTEAPGLVEGLYLVGSLALADYRPGRSDIDVVAVTSAAASGPGLAALERTHARLRAAHRRPTLDGPYVTWTDLGRHPDLGGEVPFAHGGRFHRAGRFELTPVTWHTLAGRGIACRGPVPADLTVWTDRAELRSWAVTNLATYWRRWRDRCGRLLSGHGLFSLWPTATEWGVLGVARQHHTATRGEIISKTAAAGYALQEFDPRWSAVVRESLRIRTGDAGRTSYRSSLARRRDLLDFIDTVIVDAEGRPWRTS
jgi:hypothetical protein